jgi:hypothetical protein
MHSDWAGYGCNRSMPVRALRQSAGSSKRFAPSLGSRPCRRKPNKGRGLTWCGGIPAGPPVALTVGHQTAPNCSPAVGPFRSGSARLGRSQKDGLPLPPWGDIFVGSRPSTRAHYLRSSHQERPCRWPRAVFVSTPCLSPFAEAIAICAASSRHASSDPHGNVFTRIARACQ